MIPKIKYSDKQINKLLRDLYDGRVTTEDLPEELYNQIGSFLQRGLYKGFGSTLENVTKANEAILTDLRENVWLFSAAKTYQFTKAASDLLTDENGAIKPFSQFYAEGKVISDDYLRSYATAEYNTVIANAQMAEQWQGIEANKDILPYLTFSTDGHACPECEPFEGLTAHVDDPIWDIATPTLHFSCACILIPTDDDSGVWSKSQIAELPIDTIPDDFQNNPGKTGEIFTKDNPYFADVPAKLARSNFGLSIPDED